MGAAVCNLPRLLLLLAVVSAVGASTGCGFHLRGQVELPPAMQRTYIQGDPYSELVRELRFGLRNSGVEVVREAEQATATLRILAEHQDRRVLSVGSDAKVAEYELAYTVEFGLFDPKGAPLIKPQRITLVRDYRFDSDQLLGATGEEELLRTEMRRDMVQSILRRLEYQR